MNWCPPPPTHKCSILFQSLDILFYSWPMFYECLSSQFYRKHFSVYYLSRLCSVIVMFFSWQIYCSSSSPVSVLSWCHTWQAITILYWHGVYFNPLLLVKWVLCLELRDTISYFQINKTKERFWKLPHIFKYPCKWLALLVPC